MSEAARVCVVTGGGGGGIGRGICAAVATRGFTVIVADRDAGAAASVAQQLRAAGHAARELPLDVGDPDAVAGGIDRVRREVGRVDALVNSAGIGLVKPAAAISLEEYEYLMRTDLRGAWLCARAVLPAMVEAGGGSIVNIGSVQALGPHTGYAIYAAAKAGLVGLTRGIAADYGPAGVRCNIVHPGLVDSPQNRRIIGQWADAEAWMARYLRTRQMLPRAIAPEDVGATVAFLVSDEARAITAAEIVVDGGSSAMAFDREPVL